jgi:hypothetical protein
VHLLWSCENVEAHLHQNQPEVIAFSQSWTHTVDEPDAALLAEYENLSPRGQFTFAYAWKQKLMDGMADVTSESAFIGQLDKNRDAVVNGTVRSRDMVAKPVKTPIEREIERLATIVINDAIKDTPNEKMPLDKKMVYTGLSKTTTTSCGKRQKRTSPDRQKFDPLQRMTLRHCSRPKGLRHRPHQRQRSNHQLGWGERPTHLWESNPDDKEANRHPAPSMRRDAGDRQRGA